MEKLKESIGDHVFVITLLAVSLQHSSFLDKQEVYLSPTVLLGDALPETDTSTTLSLGDPDLTLSHAGSLLTVLVLSC